jgi:hypothetical protein
MNINGFSLRDHLRLLAPLFGLIASVWALRLVLGAMGASRLVLSICSVTLAGAVALLLAVLLIHSRRAGGYANVAAAVFLLECCEQGLISAAIAFGALTGTQNVYSAPEFSFGLTPLRHILGHLTFGIGMGTLFGSATGCLLLWLLRKFVPVGAGR